MHFNIITLFPDFFNGPLNIGLMSKAKEKQLVSFSFHNPRDYTFDIHHQVDDKPFGGGSGMVMMLEPLVRCLRSIDDKNYIKRNPPVSETDSELNKENIKLGLKQKTLESTQTWAKKHSSTQLGKVLLLSPSGKPFTQKMAQELSKEEKVTILCGRYEGFDARIEELFELESISLGDFVLNGGESASLAIIESVSRLLPGFMGDENSANEESFSNGLLEYSHYTRPENFEEISVPEVLRSGNHAKIALWRKEESLRQTFKTRPELLTDQELYKEDVEVIAQVAKEKLARNLHCALVHSPITGKDKKKCTVSLTNLDIHDIARSSCTFGLRNFYISTPLKDQQKLLDDIVLHWVRGVGAKANPDRAKALALVKCVDYIEGAVDDLYQQTGEYPILIGTSALLPSKKQKNKKIAYPKNINFNELRALLKQKPVLLVFGTGHGLHSELIAKLNFMLPPIRPSGYNHLSVRSAVAIMFDRILGDWF
ncbi:tRNA (guanosine(37)-N1)-methyltransferase TrmD [Desulfovibrio litoralis]|uniref:tRNA (guanine-N(1)-)-methyltransferase n=1 Tax=Desulfovibrio litoralis DSM 11393 TaxID=1121455 RepID=A0A1M7S971_9BACT|nr:tRNA (guanosine(37)-N1)-methyltransferase TrmD [Desulfovibrio litoralis]SHN54993.1 tRNA (Guanine37-N(1)-) methyltransferase [Desulfovibrio litoralis DSM 11393]